MVRKVRIGVGSPLDAKHLVSHTELLAVLQLLLVVLHHFPPFILPLQNLNALAFQLRLPPTLLVLSPLALVGREIFLETFQSCIRT